MQNRPVVFWEDLLSDVYDNGFIIFAILFMTIFFIYGLYVTRKKDGTHPVPHTITEGMPVLGLMGTFIGALYVFYFGSEDGFEGIVVAFSVSFVGWFYYIILQFYGAIKSKPIEQTTKESLQYVRDLNDAVHMLDSNLNESLNTFNSINETLQQISKTTKLGKLELLMDAAKGCNDQLKQAATNLKSCSKSMEHLGAQAEKPIELNIKTPSNIHELVMNLEPIADIFERIQSVNKEHSFNFAVPERVSQIRSDLSQLYEVLQAIDTLPKSISIAVEENGKSETIATNLANLRSCLDTMANAPKDHMINIDFHNELNALHDFKNLVVEMQGALEAVADKEHRVDVTVDFPSTTQEQIRSLNDLKSNLKSLAEMDNNFAISVLFDGVDQQKTRSLKTFTDLVSSLQSLHTKMEFEVGLSMPEKLSSTVEEVNKLKETIQNLQDQQEHLSVSLQNIDKTHVESNRKNTRFRNLIDRVKFTR